MKKTTTLAASGIFGWEGEERRTNRYGSFKLFERPYDEACTVRARFNKGLLCALTGKRVRVTCVVTETRKSGHVGDLFLGIHPTTPTIGERIVLGVGTLAFDPDDLVIFLVPADDRTELWIDPRLLYRLHDQTVEVHIERTKAAFSPAPGLSTSSKPEAISNGDGSFQVKNIHPGEGVRLRPNVEPLGDGLFALTFQEQKAGQKLDIEVVRGVTHKGKAR